MAFVPRDQLAFDLASLIEKTIDGWSTIQGTDIDGTPPESASDLIVSELNRSGLRRSTEDSDDAVFSSDATETQFREAIIAALDRCLFETESRPRTRDEIDDYNRQCGE